MNIAIMQPYIFPYIGYFQLLKAVDTFIIFDDVNYINKGWINRNRILVNKNEYMFTIPLQMASQNKLIRQIKIIDDDIWKNKLIMTIERAYSRAPYFKNVFETIINIIKFDSQDLSEYIFHSLIQINTYLSIATKIVPSSSVYKNAHLKGMHRIIDICKKVGAASYINPIGGIELYSKSDFNEHKIELLFLKTNFVEYKQFSCKYISGLSIIDVMMFNPKEKIEEMLISFDFI